MIEQKVIKGIKLEGVEEFDSVDEFMSIIGETSEVNKELHAFIAGLDGRGGFNTSWSWLGCSNTIQGTIDIINNGWPEGVDRLMSAFEEIEVEAQSKCVKRRKRRGDFGDEIDMQQVYNGNLDSAWSRTERGFVSGQRQITLIVDLSAGGNVDGDTLFWRGAAAVYLSDVLTKSGYAVSIVGAEVSDVEYVRKEHEPFAFYINVKNHNQVLDLSTIASSICNAGFLRIPLFLALMRSEDKIGKGLGKERSLRLRFPKKVQEVNGIDGFHKIKDKDGAVAFVEDVVKKLNEVEL